MPFSPTWRFAPTNGGAEQSNNPGQITFADDPVAKAVREILQNSIDHPEPGLDGVTVSFTLMDLPAEYCNAKQLARHLRRAARLLESENDPENAARYRRAADACSKSKVRTLAIIDSGTTGLIGENWRNLIFREGKPNSDTEAAHGGSYGFGKNAPMNLSLASAVLYSTRYLERAAKGRVTKLAGRAQLITHPDPDSKESLQAIGFLADHAQAINAPITGAEIPDELLLPDTGTGLFIIAFNPDYSDWADQVAETVATDFFAAVHDRKLSVVIRSAPDAPPRIIDRDTLEMELDRLPERHPSRFYYQAYCDGYIDLTEPIGQLDDGMTSLQVRTLADPKAPRRIAHLNRRGMKITDARQLADNPFYPAGGTNWSPWCAITVANDDKTDAFIRKCEPPAHNAVQQGILKLRNPQEAERARLEYRHHREQISAKIRNRIEQSLADTGQNIQELAELFPDLPDENSGAITVATKATPQREIETSPAEQETEGNAIASISDAHSGSGSAGGGKSGPGQGGPGSGNGPGAAGQHGNADGNQESQEGRKTVSTPGTIQAARAMQTAPDKVTVAIRLPNDLDSKGAAFVIKEAGEQYQPAETRIKIKEASAYGALAAQAQIQGDAIRVTGEPGAQITVQLTLQDKSTTATAYSIVQVND